MTKTVVALALVGLAASNLYATAPGYPIQGSSHDFSATSESGSGYTGKGGLVYQSENRCTTCHAAHKAKRNYPLWARDTPAATGWIVWKGGWDVVRDGNGNPLPGQKTLIDDSVGQALGTSIVTDADIVDQGGHLLGRTYVKAADLLAGGTGLCMSCHDGSLALVSNTGGIDSSATGADSVGAQMSDTFRGNWGRDLRNMHPVGIEVPFGNPGWQASVNAGNTFSGSNVVTETNGAVGCTSCHSMHSSQKTGHSELDMKILRPGERCLSCHDR